MTKATIFTDGAAKGNPGPGGFGAVVWVGDTVCELGEARDKTTNNEMELQAVVTALQSLPKDVKEVEIYTDSKYVESGATGWVFGWMRNGWQTKAGTAVLHKEIWQSLASLLKPLEVTWHRVPGHVGLIGNERADTIASDFGAGKSVELYNGTKSDYGHQIENVDYDKEKAAARSEARKRSNQKAYSYVSVVDGVVQTHQTWVECEKRVKGKKGVRFKKALSSEEEQALIAEFSR